LKLSALDLVDAPPEDRQRRTIVNLTQKELSTDEQSVLSKGNHCKCGKWNTIVANTYSRAKPPKSNLTFGERTALKTLNPDREILILPTDKGNATVIISTTAYERKIETLLDPITYKKLPRDPTGRLLRNTNQLIKDSTTVTAEDISKRKKTEALPPRLDLLLVVPIRYGCWQSAWRA